MTTPLSGTVCHQQAWTCYDNLPTKFEMPIFTRYGNMKDAAKCWKWGGLVWLGVTQDHWK